MINPHVIVIGAGLGGLCLAHGLRRAGIDVAVYERDVDESARPQGHRLHIDARGRKALAATLPEHLFSRLAATIRRPAPRVNGFDHHLRATGVFPLDDPTPEPGHAEMPAHTVIERHVLRRILLTGIEDVVHYGRRCVGYDTNGDGVTARFDDGSTATGSILVGADGISSAIRARRLPHARVMDTRARLIYGRVPLTPELRRTLPPAMFSVFNSVLGPDRRFVGIAPVADTLAVMFGCRRERLGLPDHDLRAAPGHHLRDLVQEHLTGWHPLMTRIVDAWDPDSVHPVVVHTSVPVPPWKPSNVTLLGDAIHAMSPAAGAGANMALRDASELTSALAAALTHHRPLLDAIGDYEHAMTTEGFRMVRVSAANATRTLGADPIQPG
ncbi:FAD-dependent oxidoreductase [Pseudonocardia acaciae]|uniref:FAD-dependent oxidoreductase n=1 Tax=Pseudonocardia acaciae TaxID=551276 RepID=UPI00048E99AD|nr:NAD(P)/FAD-dependent oxidoreductase [Pseudonocardia acaciae]